jgi:hypothetical protein
MSHVSQKRGGGWAPRSNNTSAGVRGHSHSTDELPVGPCLAKIEYDDLYIGSRFDRSSASIGSCEYIASYSWMEAKIPTIMVPGRTINGFKLLTY